MLANRKRSRKIEENTHSRTHTRQKNNENTLTTRATPTTTTNIIFTSFAYVIRHFIRPTECECVCVSARNQQAKIVHTAHRTSTECLCLCLNVVHTELRTSERARDDTNEKSV